MSPPKIPERCLRRRRLRRSWAVSPLLGKQFGRGAGYGNSGPAVKVVHQLDERRRIGVAFVVGDQKKPDFARILIFVEHVQSEHVVHVVAHVCFEDDADGFCGGDASSEEHGRRDQAENGF